MSDASVDSTSTAVIDDAQAHHEALSSWNLPLEELYRYSVKFLKDKDGSKALRLSYADKILLVAYEKQVAHGPFRANSAHDCGFFDVVGNDRKHAWSALGDLSRGIAMLEHVKLVHSRCPLLSVYIQAQTQIANQKQAISHANLNSRRQLISGAIASETHNEKENTSQEANLHNANLQSLTMPQVTGATINESDTDTQAKIDNLSNDLQKLKLEEEQLRSQQEAQIRTLLNQQTAIQFRQYAQEQHANDPKKQEELVRQLQQQHFQQYMTQVLKQQIEHQKQQARQIAALLRQQRKQQIEQLAANATNGETDSNGGAPQGGLQIVDEAEDGAESRSSQHNGAHALAQIKTPAAAVAAPEANTGVSTTALVVPRSADDAESNVDDDTDGDISDADDESDAGRVRSRAQRKRCNDVRSSAAATSSLSAAKPGDQSINVSTNGHDQTRALSEANHAAPEKAKWWTRKDISEFKSRLKSEKSSGAKIPNGGTLIVRVPTHPDGSCIFWEFASDNYDIGFGVYFEWNLNPGDKITVHISESDDEDPEDEDAPPHPDGPSGKDPERGKKKENEQPTDEIIPVYRRDSHEEVYCGSHTYPGKGVYLLKFDNSYSLWRSKWVYYRVYYGK